MAEELGFIGAVVVLLLFSLLIMQGYWLALHARDKFGALTIVGIITLLAVQVFPERGRGHQSDPQYRNLPPLLQLRRNSADDPAGGDGDRIEHIQTDPGTQK